MSNRFEVECELNNNYYGYEKTSIEIIFSQDWDDIFSYEYEIGKDEAIEARKSVDNFQIFLNENKISYDKEDLDSLREEVVEKIRHCLKENKGEDEYVYFNRSSTTSSLHNNDCKFSYNFINKVLNRVRNGDTKLTPDGKSIPKSIDFINGDGDRCFAYITSVYVFPINATDKMNDAEYGRASYIMGLKDEQSQKIIVLTFGYLDISRRSPELKYYQFENVELFNADSGLINLYDMGEARETVQTNCDFADILMPYHDYYSLCLKELESKNDDQKMTVDLEFLHDYYVEIDNLTVDQGSSVLPIKGKAFRFKEVQIDCTINNKVEQYPFYGGEIVLLDEEDTNEVFSQLKEQDIEVPKNITFIRFNYSELGDKDQNIIESLIASGKYDKIQIGYNITGDITRTKRIIEGIEKCLLGEVTNPSLVELICSNNTSEIISNIIDSNEYKPNKKYIEELKKKYWTLRENEEQIRAIDKIVQMDNKGFDLMLVQGPPGTGKTELILSLIKELYQKNFKVLVTSNVQVACDNIVDRLKNFRNIPLKRYSTIKGEKYEKEILENEQKYIKNQVLAGFSLYLDNGKAINLVLDSKDEHNRLLEIKKEFDEKVLLIESEKQHYLDSLKEYNDLLSEKDSTYSLLKDLSEQIKGLEAINKALTEEINDLESESAVLKDNIKEQLEKLSKQKEKNSNAAEKNKELEAALNKLFDSKEEEVSRKTKIEKSINEANISLESNKKLLSAQLSLIDRMNLVDLNVLNKQVNDYLINGQFDTANEYPLHLFDEVFSDAIPVINAVTYIKTIISNDGKFLYNGQNLSLSCFDSIYYRLKDEKAFLGQVLDDGFFTALEDIKHYYSAGKIKTVLSSAFPFIKINGKPHQKYQEQLSVFNDALKRIYYSFDSIVKSIVESGNSKGIIESKKEEVNKTINGLRSNIDNSEKQVQLLMNELSALDQNLFSISGDIEDYTKKLDKNHKTLEKNAEKYNSDYSYYLTTVEKEKQLAEQLENCKKAMLEKANTLEEIKNTFENKKGLYKEIESKIMACYEEKQELIDDFDAFMQSKDIAKIRYQKYIDSIQDVIDAFNERVNTFVNAGWSAEDAENVLFDYAADLRRISEIKIDKDNGELKYSIDGYGTAFREMFELNDTGKGSIISMTTNQVASLLRSTTNDELTFDYAIIDEASKCTFEDVVISLPRVRHLILIGDFMQLDKLYKQFNQIDLKYQNTLSYSLWDALNCSTFYQCLSAAVAYNDDRKLTTFDNNPMVSVMKKQYRMNKGIFDLVKPIYEIHKEFELIDQKQSTFNDLLCLQVDGDESQDDNKSSSNQKEGLAVVNILKEINEHRDIYPGIKTIGVITGYRAQENFIRKSLKGEKKIAGLEIGTYDRFQGREYDLVLMSLVRTERLGFNSNLRRMNVAISRAKNHLIILGNFEKLLNVAKRTSYVNDDDYEANKEELEFVTKHLIPQLYNLKKKFPSEEAMKKAVIKFLREEDNE